MTDGLPLRRKKKNAQLWRRSVFCVYLTNLTLAPAFKTHMSFLISSLKTWHRLFGVELRTGVKKATALKNTLGRGYRNRSGPLPPRVYRSHRLEEQAHGYP